MTTDLNALSNEIAALVIEQPEIIPASPKLSNAPANVSAERPPGSELNPTYSRQSAWEGASALLAAGVAPDVVIAALAKDGHIFELEEARTPQQIKDAASADTIAPAKSEYNLGHLAAHAEKIGSTTESIGKFTEEARIFSTELQFPPALASAFFDRVLETAGTYDSLDDDGRESWIANEKAAIASVAHRYGGSEKMAALVKLALDKGSPAFRAKLEKSNTLSDRFTYAMLAGQGLALEAATRLRGSK